MSYKKERKTGRYRREEKHKPYSWDRSIPNPIGSASQYGLMQAVASGVARVKGISKHIAEEMISQTSKRDRSKFSKELAKRRRNNPNSEVEASEEALEMARKFHGREAKSVDVIDDTIEYEEEAIVIGDLVELTIIDPKNSRNGFDISFEPGNRPLVTCNVDGTNIEFDGGDQSLEIGSMKGLEKIDIQGKNYVVIGEVLSIVYFTDKHHLEGPEEQKEGIEYQHEFGEEGGKPPLLVYDIKNQKMSLAGGSYKVEDVGIKN